MVCGLVMSSALSLRASRVMKLERFAPHDYTWYFALSLISVGSSVLGILLSLYPWHRVPWLLDRFSMKRVEDKGDVWLKKDNALSSSLSSLSDDNASSEIQVHPASAPYQEELEMTSNGEGKFFPENDIDTVDSVPVKRPSVKDKKTFNSTGDSRHDLARKLSKKESDRGRESKPWTNMKIVIFVISKLLFTLTFILSLSLHSYAVAASLKNSSDDIEFAMIISSFVSCGVLSVGVIVYVIYHSAIRCKVGCRIPFLAKFIAPFCLSSATRALIEANAKDSDFANSAKIVASYFWIYLIAFLLLFALLETCIDLYPVYTCCSSLWHFITKNIKESGVNKKTVRFFDTVGSVAALTALILGLCSLFIDQYDLYIEPEGVIEEAIQAGKVFYSAVKPITLTLTRMIDTIDRKFDCPEVYTALGTGAAITLFTSFFPGASSVASIGTRSAYYGVRAANALTNLASRLRKSKNTVWQVAKAVLLIQKFALGTTKLAIKSTVAVIFMKLLPFAPPVVIGLYVLFAAFWPQRMLFFTAKQRRKAMDDQFYTWLLSLFLLSLAITINTWLVDEVVRLLNDNIPIASVHVERKLGWNLNMAAAAFSLLSGLSFTIRSFILKWQTWKNHENITNEELDWKYELEKRELITIRTAVGSKIEKRTQLKYKKERIGPWTWVLPILLCSAACGFGFLANVNPKLEFSMEPKGTMGRMIDRVLDRIDFYDVDKHDVKNDTSKECLPYTSFSDAMTESGYSSILMKPVDEFFNETEKIVKPLRDSLTGLRKQLLLDFQEDLFGTTLDNFWTQHDLQYLGMLFTAPRIICLLILLFGMFMASIHVCCMRIFQAVEPARLISAYGKVCIFSVVYVIGTQMAIYILLSDIGVPFYRISIRFGLGFVYDVVADFILLSVYIGMNNQFFFAVPKRRTIVAYEIPGASTMGPNIPGQIV